MAWVAALLAACASGPPPPDWQADAKSAIDSAVAATLTGNNRREAQDLDRARAQIARTGRADLMARVELMHCAARVASLAFEPCEGFERLRTEAAAPERVYADHLAARTLAHDDIERLPTAQRGAAVALSVAPAGGSISLASLRAIDDPLSRLIAIAVLFRAGKADPTMMALATDTASQQGWRRPLLAWLEVQTLRADGAGDTNEAQRLRRRMQIVSEGR